MLGSSPERGIFLTFSQWKVCSCASEYAFAYHNVWGSTASRDGPAGDKPGPVGVSWPSGSELLNGVDGVSGEGRVRVLGGVPGGKLSSLAAAVDLCCPRMRVVGDDEASLPSDKSSTSTTSSVYGTLTGESRSRGRTTTTPSSASSEAPAGGAEGGTSSGKAGRVMCGSR